MAGLGSKFRSVGQYLPRCAPELSEDVVLLFFLYFFHLPQCRPFFPELILKEIYLRFSVLYHPEFLCRRFLVQWMRLAHRSIPGKRLTAAETVCRVVIFDHVMAGWADEPALGIVFANQSRNAGSHAALQQSELSGREQYLKNNAFTRSVFSLCVLPPESVST